MERLDADDLLAELIPVFLAEADEHIQVMNRHVLALERGVPVQARGEVIAELFRAAHSLKGAARAVRLSEVEALAHELEDLFARVRDRELEPEPAVLDGAYQSLDAISSAVERWRTPAAQTPVSDSRELTADVGSGPAAEPGSADTVLETEVTTDGGSTGWFITPGQQAAVDSMRVATAKVDDLMAAVSELHVSRIGTERRLDDARELESMLDELDSTRTNDRRRLRHSPVRHQAEAHEELSQRVHTARMQLAAFRHELEADARRDALAVDDLRDAVRRIRMLPVSTVFEPVPRIVRDLARDAGKEVRLSLTGSETEVDRSVLEAIKDALTHLIRNAVVHGIEPPAVRAEAGKDIGSVSLSARHEGGMLLIELRDDGAGIDLNAVRAEAVREGLLSSDAAAALPDRDAVALIFRPGLSTRATVTDLAGRGVGLDVVRQSVEQVGGWLDVDNAPGHGTTFTLSLPLSISTINCLLVEASEQTFALPVGAIERVLRAGPDEVGRASGRYVIRLDEGPVPLAELATVLALDHTDAALAPRAALKRPVVVLRAHQRIAAFAVDGLLETHEVVIKTLPAPLIRVRYIAGATILGSGGVAMLLDAGDLIEAVELGEFVTAGEPGPPATQPATILVVEDSITTRTLEKSILEAAGYRVQTAADGEAGWDLFRSGACDLVIADIEMPGIDGFELTARIRADADRRDLPVVLVTSRDSRDDHERGLAVGADAYIVKGAFDQERLLDTIRRLL